MITFGYLLESYKYEYKTKIKTQCGILIVFENDYHKFIEELKAQGVYDEYIDSLNEGIPVKETGEQYDIFDYLE